MDSRQARIGREDWDAILPLMAIMLMVLIGAAAMAVDLGWLFWQSIEIQHGADAAALSGVIYEPDQRTEAHTEGIAAAAENGYVDTSLQVRSAESGSQRRRFRLGRHQLG